MIKEMDKRKHLVYPSFSHIKLHKKIFTDFFFCNFKRQNISDKLPVNIDHDE